MELAILLLQDAILQQEDQQTASIENSTFANDKQKEFYERAQLSRESAITELRSAINLLEEHDVLIAKNPLLEYRSTLREAISRWGEQAQINMLHEEIGELMQAVNKLMRSDSKNYGTRREDLIEEVADVEIMLEQIKLMVSGHAGVHSAKITKLKRLQDRLDETDKPAE